MTFMFDVGAKVGFYDRRTKETQYTVVQRLPGEDNASEPRYKIKAVAEGFERVVVENELNSVFEDSQTRSKIKSKK